MLFQDCNVASGAVLYSRSGSLIVSNVQFVNVSTASSTYQSEAHSSQGDVTTETTIVRTGGASNGTTGFSRKMISTSSTNPVNAPLNTNSIVVWNALTGASHTATIEIVSSGTLNNNDIWMELEYLGSSSTGQGSVVSSAPSTLTAGTALPTSSATWASLPATPVKQNMSVTFTPQQAGFVKATVRLGKPSTTVYVDPVLTIV
jgi:hypothetical protein